MRQQLSTFFHNSPSKVKVEPNYLKLKNNKVNVFFMIIIFNKRNKIHICIYVDTATKNDSKEGRLEKN